MKHFTVVRSLDIHYAHRVPRHKGKCAGLHGHRGTITVYVDGVADAMDMVVDFGELAAFLEAEIKALLCHHTILDTTDPLFTDLGLGTHGASVELFCEGFGMVSLYHCAYGDVVGIPYAPTAERLAQLVYAIVAPKFTVSRVSFQETEHSVAWFPRG